MRYIMVLSLFAGFVGTSSANATGKQLCEKAGVPYPAVIAHRGASYYAPEETMPSYLLARDLGADYLEADLQRTKDNVIIALHDTNLKRTTNIEQVYPQRANDPVSTFTVAELKKLDAGSWFNKAYPERARPSYVGLKILTLDELIDISEGVTPKAGLYLETKVPTLFPGIEKDLFEQLKKRGVLKPDTSKKSRVVLQTFEKDSLPLLHKYMPQVPTCFLLWLDDGAMASTTPNGKPAKNQTPAQYGATLQVTRPEFEKWIDFAKANGAACTGPASTLHALGDQSYMDLDKPWMNELTHQKGLFIHAYTVDDPIDFKRISEAGVDGFFTNRSDVLLKFYKRKVNGDIDSILKKNGF